MIKFSLFSDRMEVSSPSFDFDDMFVSGGEAAGVSGSNLGGGEGNSPTLLEFKQELGGTGGWLDVYFKGTVCQFSNFNIDLVSKNEKTLY